MRRTLNNGSAANSKLTAMPTPAANHRWPRHSRRELDRDEIRQDPREEHLDSHSHGTPLFTPIKPSATPCAR